MIGVLTRVTLHAADEQLTGFGCLTATIPERTRVSSFDSSPDSCCLNSSHLLLVAFGAQKVDPGPPQVVTQLVVHSNDLCTWERAHPRVGRLIVFAR